MFNVALAYTADQSIQTDWAKSQVVSNKNVNLFSLLAVNKSGTDYWLQVYDHPSAATGTPLEIPLISAGFTSLNYPNGKKFWNGCFVRAVDAAGGSIITGDDVKFTAEFMQGPVS